MCVCVWYVCVCGVCACKSIHLTLIWAAFALRFIENDIVVSSATRVPVAASTPTRQQRQQQIQQQQQQQQQHHHQHYYGPLPSLLLKARLKTLNTKASNCSWANKLTQSSKRGEQHKSSMKKKR